MYFWVVLHLVWILETDLCVTQTSQERPFSLTIPQDFSFSVRNCLSTGRVLNILDANYGCRRTVPNCEMFFDACENPTSFQTIRDSCQCQSTCMITASNSFFGATCQNTRKQVFINATCIRNTSCSFDLASTAAPNSATTVTIQRRTSSSRLTTSEFTDSPTTASTIDTTTSSVEIATPQGLSTRILTTSKSRPSSFSRPTSDVSDKNTFAVATQQPTNDMILNTLETSEETQRSDATSTDLITETTSVIPATTIVIVVLALSVVILGMIFVLWVFRQRRTKKPSRNDSLKRTQQISLPQPLPENIYESIRSANFQRRLSEDEDGYMLPPNVDSSQDEQNYEQLPVSLLKEEEGYTTPSNVHSSYESIIEITSQEHYINLDQNRENIENTIAG